MTWHPAFEAAAEAAAKRLGVEQLRILADRLGGGWPEQAIRQAVPVPGFAEAAGAVLAALRTDAVPDAEAAAYLRGLAAGHAQRSAAVRIESVWSGPSTHPVPVRATAQVLVELVGAAGRELLLMTYSAKPYPPLLEALATAVSRGVDVTVVVETLAGAGSALGGAEPAAAFAAVPGAELWHWPVDQRAADGAKMHAKIAVADRRVLLVSSANLTQSGVVNNIEAGLLVQGGTAPQRAAEHIAELKAKGVLTRLRASR
ncbi:DISARM system phospholipase D-like protein DrmC [Micromonospora aurantiaca]|uniref:phospholipase D n=1 Tax=Micromonospora aurantiaca (nom. illeg.) TaxID=47850 RepID=A0A6N3K5X0_9ACTN|nr:DISARM system phospholipase D-like protein DrmC [Micromonospora aurantiaca]AXH93555.1 endonuclease [Micromonospora aurantiaca]